MTARDRFERAARARHWGLARDARGDYYDMRTRFAWAGFCLAEKDCVDFKARLLERGSTTETERIGDARRRKVDAKPHLPKVQVPAP